MKANLVNKQGSFEVGPPRVNQVGTVEVGAEKDPVPMIAYGGVCSPG